MSNLMSCPWSWRHLCLIAVLCAAACGSDHDDRILRISADGVIANESTVCCTEVNKLIAIVRVDKRGPAAAIGVTLTGLDAPLQLSALVQSSSAPAPVYDRSISFGDPDTGAEWIALESFDVPATQYLYVFVFATDCDFATRGFKLSSGSQSERFAIKNSCAPAPPPPPPAGDAAPDPVDTGMFMKMTGSARTTDALLADTWAGGLAPSTDFDPTNDLEGGSRVGPAAGITRVWMPGDVGITPITQPERTRDRTQALFLSSYAPKVTDPAHAELFITPDTAGSNAMRLTDYGAEGRSVLSAAWSPDASQIALFVTDVAGTSAQLYVYNFAAQTLEPFESAAFVGIPRASWSPDGTRIVYGFGTTLSVVEVATGLVTALVDGKDADWHPSADRIAFAQGGTIWETDSAGAAPIEVTDATIPADERLTQWSPDGLYLGFIRDVAGSDYLVIHDFANDWETRFNNLFSPTTHLDW